MKKLFFLSLAFVLALSVQAQKNMAHKKTMTKDYLMLKDGKMMETKDGNTMEMTQDMTLKNGSVVMMDGTVKMKNGQTRTLKEGDCVYMNGVISHKGMKMKKGTMKKKSTT